jgi:putative ABC transport system permease protein
MVVSVLSLGFGIACATTFFSLINAVLLRPSPYIEDPDRLVVVFDVDYAGRYGNMSYPDIVDIREQSEALAALEAITMSHVMVSTGSEAERQEQAEEVSEGYFDLLGVPIEVGRGFMADDQEVDWNVAVISHRRWQRDYDGDPEVLGKSIRVEGRYHTIVGVAPPGLLALGAPAAHDLWIPLRRSWRENRGIHGVRAVGRLADGATVETARAQAKLVAGRLADAYPQSWSYFQGQANSVDILGERVSRLPPHLRAPILGVAAMISMVIGLVLLVACSNVANLLLTRAVRRRSEIAVRLALGASRRHLVQQLLTESAAVAVIAGGVGLLTTHLLTRLLAHGSTLLPIPVTPDIGVDLRVACFSLLMALVTIVAFGLAPALQASRTELIAAIKGDEGGSHSRRFDLRRALVNAQVAGSLVLVVGSVLLLRSLQQASTVDLGFEPENLAVLSLDLSHRQYEAEAGRQLYSDLCDRLRALPGVESVAMAQTAVLGWTNVNVGQLEPEGYQQGPDENVMAAYNLVTPGYFELLGMPLLSGRDFRPDDSPGTTKVAIVNQEFADRYWPGQDAVGKRIGSKDPLLVVGVVGNARYHSVTADPPPHLWQPFNQIYRPAATIHIRTTGDPSPLLISFREQVRALDSELPIISIDLMESIVDDATLLERIVSALLSGTGVITMALAMIGIYGVMAFSISQRRREVGVRIALGADPRMVVLMIIRDGIYLSLVGLAVGLGVVLLLTPVLGAVLFGVSPLDPLSLMVGVGLLMTATVAASLPVALQAARLNPIESLRTE